MTALACQETPCAATRPTIGALTAHLVNDHLISASTALQRAREAATVELPASRVDPYGLDKHGVKTHVEPPVTPAVTPPVPKEPAMPKTTKPCRICATPFVPATNRSVYCPPCTKNRCGTCKRPGGTHAGCSRTGKDAPKTRTGGSKAPSRSTRPAVGNGLPSFESARTFLDTQIEELEGKLAKLKEVRGAMAWLTESSRS